MIYKNVNTTGTIPANAIFSTGTYGQGTDCQLIVTSEQGGTVFILNSANDVLFGEPTTPKVGYSFCLWPRSAGC